MRPLSRRDFLLGAAGGAMLGLPGAAALAQTDKFDLVIKGGEVLDLSQLVRARRDVGIRNAVIAALEPDIPEANAKQTLNVRGRLVLPGLIDMHAHVYPQVSALGLPADELVPYTATTTYVSAGDAGANTFSALKHYIVAQARSRIYAFVHISSIGLSGFPVGEMLNIDYADVDQAAKTLAENPELVLGIKVRESVDVVGANGLEPLRRAILACERSGVRGARVMCHIGNAPGELPALLDLLRPGDILTHAYSGAGNNTVRDGKKARRHHRRRPRRRQLRLHGGGAGDPAGLHAGHDRQRHPRGERQHARDAVPALGDEQVSQPGILAGAGGDHGHGDSGQDRRQGGQARHARDRRARRRLDPRAGRRPGGLRRHAQERAQGQPASEAGRDGARGKALRKALSVAVQLSVIAGMG